jgi:hypothetical protein
MRLEHGRSWGFILFIPYPTLSFCFAESTSAEYATTEQGIKSEVRQIQDTSCDNQYDRL